MGLFDKLRDKIDSFAQQHLAPSDKQRAAMLHYCNTKKGKPIVKGGEYPRYMKYTYQIEVPELLQEIMVKEGYLSMDDAGNCHPTETGLQLLDEYEWLFRVSRYNITIEEFESAYNQYPTPKPKTNDIIWGILNKRINDDIGRYGLIRNTYLDMSKLLGEEERHGEELQYLLWVLWFDLSGFDNNARMNIRNVEVYESIANSISSLHDFFKQEYLDGIEAMTPASCTGKETFSEIVRRIISGEDYSGLLPQKMSLREGELLEEALEELERRK